MVFTRTFLSCSLFAWKRRSCSWTQLHHGYRSLPALRSGRQRDQLPRAIALGVQVQHNAYVRCSWGVLHSCPWLRKWLHSYWAVVLNRFFGRELLWKIVITWILGGTQVESRWGMGRKHLVTFFNFFRPNRESPTLLYDGTKPHAAAMHPQQPTTVHCCPFAAVECIQSSLSRALWGSAAITIQLKAARSNANTAVAAAADFRNSFTIFPSDFLASLRSEWNGNLHVGLPIVGAMFDWST